MYKFLNPLIHLATANLEALSRFAIEPEGSEGDRMAEFWRDTMNNQARFVSECTQGWMQVLARQRALLDGQWSQLSDGAERVAAEMARTTARAVGIATQARRGKRDRRIFSVPLPVDRRIAPRSDRRTRIAAILPPVALPQQPAG